MELELLAVCGPLGGRGMRMLWISLAAGLADHRCFGLVADAHCFRPVTNYMQMLSMRSRWVHPNLRARILLWYAAWLLIFAVYSCFCASSLAAAPATVLRGLKCVVSDQLTQLPWKRLPPVLLPGFIVCLCGRVCFGPEVAAAPQP